MAVRSLHSLEVKDAIFFRHEHGEHAWETLHHQALVINLGQHSNSVDQALTHLFEPAIDVAILVDQDFKGRDGGRHPDWAGSECTAVADSSGCECPHDFLAPGHARYWE